MVMIFCIESGLGLQGKGSNRDEADRLYVEIWRWMAGPVYIFTHRHFKHARIPLDGVYFEGENTSNY